MNKLIYLLIFASTSSFAQNSFFSPESSICDLVQKLESSNTMRVERADGGVRLHFDPLMGNETEITATAIDTRVRAEAVFGGRFSYTPKKILNQDYCLLTKRISSTEHNSIALITDPQNSNKIRIYVGMGKPEILEYFIKTGTYFLLTPR